MKIRTVLAALVLLSMLPVWAHVGQRASIHDTVAGVIARMRETLSDDEAKRLSASDAYNFLTEEERQILAEDYIVFRVNVPVVVSIVHDAGLRDEPFWLKDRGFKQTKTVMKVVGKDFDVWEKDFEAGEIGLGVNSLTGGGRHYFAGVRPQRDRDARSLEIKDIYPGLHTVTVFQPGATPWADSDDEVLEEVPKELMGALLVRGLYDRRRDAMLSGIFRTTEWPATPAPDHVVLTWSGDPQTTQTVQWRTSTATTGGVVAYARKDAGAFDPATAATVPAETKSIVQNTLLNDPIVHWHTAMITGLEPGASYVYAVGDGQGAWRAAAEFTTVPEGPVSFNFIYMGDAQNGLDTWGNLIHKSFAHKPDTAFYIMAGDLVNRGAERDDWDSLFHNAEGIWDRKQVVPVPGNHEYQGGTVEMYLQHFALPEDSPLGELNYTLRYGNALFIMLDSNRPPHTQAAWLEEQLANTDATWKIVVYHHPAYSSGANRDNKAVRQVWGALFDKYHVDLALQGHDHAYLRTYPMKAEQRVGSPAEGTIYIVSVSGTKYYEQGQFDYTEFGMTNVSTYQVLDIKIDGNRLEYGAYDVEGAVRDTFVIEK